MDASDLLNDHRVIPVVVIDNPAHAVPLGKTLLDNGIHAIEITLRTEAALASIEAIAGHIPELILGAGSIRDANQIPAAARAGARFLVSPGSTDTLIAEARKTGLPFVPGAATASEMLHLLEHGYRLQKFFPAEQLGGLALIDALAAPLPEVMFFPTGGINHKLALDYLEHPNVACIGGSWFVPKNLIAEGEFESIGKLAAEAARLWD